MHRIALSIALVAQLPGCSQILGLQPATQRPSDASTDDASSDAPIDAPLPNNCTTYCTTITANCSGPNAQFGGATAQDALDHCMATCAKFDPSAATTGATLGCRIFFANAAKFSPTIHCPHASPAGDQVNAASGVCGDPCPNFCSIEIAGCTGANAEYADMNTCLVACAAFDKTHLYVIDTSSFPAATPSGNSLACRIYHTTNALISPTTAAVHCPHTQGSPNGPCAGAAMP